MLYIKKINIILKVRPEITPNKQTLIASITKKDRISRTSNIKLFALCNSEAIITVIRPVPYPAYLLHDMAPCCPFLQFGCTRSALFMCKFITMHMIAWRDLWNSCDAMQRSELCLILSFWMWHTARCTQNSKFVTSKAGNCNTN